MHYNLALTLQLMMKDVYKTYKPLTPQILLGGTN